MHNSIFSIIIFWTPLDHMAPINAPLFSLYHFPEPPAMSLCPFYRISTPISQCFNPTVILPIIIPQLPSSQLPHNLTPIDLQFLRILRRQHALRQRNIRNHRRRGQFRGRSCYPFHLDRLVLAQFLAVEPCPASAEYHAERKDWRWSLTEFKSDIRGPYQDLNFVVDFEVMLA